MSLHLKVGDPLRRFDIDQRTGVATELLREEADIQNLGPTTISSANAIENTVPDLEEETKKFAETGQFTDNDGTLRFSDGEPVEEKDDNQLFLENLARFNRAHGRIPNDSTGVKKTTGGGIETTGAFDEEGNVIGGTKPEVTADQSEADEFDRQSENLIAQMKASFDEVTKRQIDDIERRFAMRREQQRDINLRFAEGRAQSLLIGGSSRFAQISSAGIMAAQFTAGLRALSAIDAEEKSLINSALQAQAENNFELLETRLGLAQEKRKEKQKATEKLAQKIADENKKLREKLRTSNIGTAIIDLKEKGFEEIDDIVAFLKESGIEASVDEIKKIQALLETEEAKEQTFTGDLRTFKEFFPDVDITTPEGKEQFLKFVAELGAAGRKPDSEEDEETGENPLNWTSSQINKGMVAAGDTTREDFLNRPIEEQQKFILGEKADLIGGRLPEEDLNATKADLVERKDDGLSRDELEALISGIPNLQAIDELELLLFLDEIAPIKVGIAEGFKGLFGK